MRTTRVVVWGRGLRQIKVPSFPLVCFYVQLFIFLIWHSSWHGKKLEGSATKSDDTMSFTTLWVKIWGHSPIPNFNTWFPFKIHYFPIYTHLVPSKSVHFPFLLLFLFHFLPLFLYISFFLIKTPRHLLHTIFTRTRKLNKQSKPKWNNMIVNWIFKFWIKFMCSLLGQIQVRDLEVHYRKFKASSWVGIFCIWGWIKL